MQSMGCQTAFFDWKLGYGVSFITCLWYLYGKINLSSGMRQWNKASGHRLEKVAIAVNWLVRLVSNVLVSGSL